MARQITYFTYGYCLVACLVTLFSTGLLSRAVLGASDCSCPAVYDPVCSSKNLTTYPNSCIANCTLLGKDTWTLGSCDYKNPFDRCYPEVTCSGDPCAVTSKDFADAMTSTCLSVRCMNAKHWSKTSQTIDPCSAVWIPQNGTPFVRKTDLKFSNKCTCSTDYVPVCGVDRQTYTNDCEAKCRGVQVAYNDACSSCRPDCICTLEYRPVCGSDGLTYGNTCEAYCCGVSVQSTGVCNGAAVRSPASPPPKSSGAQNPLATNPPSAPPDSPDVPDTPDAPTPCTGKPPPASCTKIPSLPGAPACSDCPTDYQPVCGVDYKNYPNKCIADCLGATIKKIGKCNHCNGEECIIGKKNDLCILAVPSNQQCWDVKYECKAASDVKYCDFLGKCQQRPAVPPPSAPAHKAGRRLAV
ncbi:hypothetical protein VaNZ11_011800 [Volvox africanus]|uniref:Kazal-like domain-containing protein n=1 Tax=Volvox africanus TaxID=51714 RepID=A0ABQ5SCA2_9CHLO|nr:hypothetical protein VaNZ11_011800 [Volvox africanus]